MKNLTIKNCLICNIKMELIPCRKMANYCSRKCYVRSRIGTKHSEEAKMKIAKGHLGNKNGMWKEKILLTSLHEWIRRHKPKPEFCEKCQITKPYDLANISQKYYRDTNDFEWLCRKCHMEKDGRLENLKRTQFQRVRISL